MGKKRPNSGPLRASTRKHSIYTQTYATTRFGKLKPRETIDLGQRIEAFGEVYKVPKRWQERTEEIGEKLFRRIRQLIQSEPGLPSDSGRLQALLTVLELLLYFLSQEDHGKEPFGFAMMWWLASLINHEVEPATQDPSHPMPQVTALLQAVAIESNTDVRVRPLTGEGIDSTRIHAWIVA